MYKCYKRDSVNLELGKEVKIGKTATSKCRVPLNGAAVAAIEELRQERNFGPTAPLVSDEKGGYTRPVNFPQKVLPDSKSRWDRAERAPCLTSPKCQAQDTYFLHLTQKSKDIIANVLGFLFRKCLIVNNIF